MDSNHLMEEVDCLILNFALPNECWVKIFSYLKKDELIKVSHVCRSWREETLFQLVDVTIDPSFGLQQYQSYDASMDDRETKKRRIQFSDKFREAMVLLHLCPRLQSIDACLSTMIEDTHISLMPCKLQCLRLAGASSINNDAIEAISFKLKELKELDVSNTNIDDLGMAFLANNETLTKLNVSHTWISDASGEYMPRTLVTLDASFTAFTNEAIHSLPTCITELNLNKSTFTDEGRYTVPSRHQITDECIEDLPAGLVSLSLAGTYVGGDLSQLPTSLTILDLTSTRATNEGISSLPSSLHTLCLKDTLVSHESFLNLPDSITNLDVSMCLRVGEGKEYRALSKGTPLTTLNIGTTKCSNWAVQLLPKSITSLSLSTLRHLNDTIFENLPPTLLELDLSDCHSLVGKTGSIPLTTSHLTLRGCKNICPSFLKRLPYSLDTIDLSGTLTNDDVIKSLPRGLRHLVLEDCILVTVTGLLDLPPHLVSLSLKGCTQLILSMDALLPLLPVYLNSLCMVDGTTAEFMEGGGESDEEDDW